MPRDHDPDNHSGRILIAKNVDLTQAGNGIETCLQRQGYGPAMSFEKYCKLANEDSDSGQKRLEFTSYYADSADGWSYLWAGEVDPKELSADWNTLVCEAEQIEH